MDNSTGNLTWPGHSTNIERVILDTVAAGAIELVWIDLSKCPSVQADPDLRDRYLNVACRILLQCQRYGVPFMVCVPAFSRVWRFKRLQSWQRKLGAATTMV